MDWSDILMYLVNVAFIFFLVFIDKKEARSTLLWVMLALFLPIVGIVLYGLIGQDFRKKKMFKNKKEQDQKLKNIVDKQLKDISESSFSFKNNRTKDYEKLIKLNLNSDDSIITQDNKVDLFYWGEDKFKRLLEDISNRKKSIDIQYYIFKSDDVGKRVLKALERKLEEGIKVRLLVDGVGSRFLNQKEDFFQSYIEKGGDFAIFFPSFLNINLRLNYRNHRKIVVIDDNIGYIGGFNVGDDYLGKYKKFGLWRDTHMRLEGSACYGLKTRFIKDWYYAKGGNIDEEADIVFNEKSKGNVAMQIVSSGPDTQEENIKNAILEMLSKAERRIVIQTPYFIPDGSLQDILSNALLSHIQVDIMIPNKPDHIFVYWASKAHVSELLKLGANVYIYDKGFLHSKTIIVDDFLSYVGSANFDERSFKLNFEAGAIIYDEKTNRKLKEQIDKDIEDSYKYTMELYKNRPGIERIKEPISKLFSPLL